MRGFLRPARIFWLLGLVLLIATVAGAGSMLRAPNGGNAPAKDNQYGMNVPFDGKFIICFGHVDVEPGITKLYPLQFGRVDWVVKEGQSVEKGKDLLRLEAKGAHADWTRAQLALDDAQLVLKEAHKLTEKHDLEIKSRESAIAALEADRKAAEHQVAKMKDLQSKEFGNKFDLNAAEEQVKKADALIVVEKNKLAILKKFGPEEKIKRAELDVSMKEQLVAKAKLALDEHTVVAPGDGTVLRVFAGKGETLGANPKLPAIEFCPKLPRIIRAEVLQEWADRVATGQEAIIEDDSSSNFQWKGKVMRISDWFTHRRSILQEPFQFNDVRTVECIIEVNDNPQGKKLRIGQRMRVLINQGGP